MLIIFGTKLRARAIATGEFFCPSCGVDRNYVLQQVRRWFTLFFLPVVPMGKVLGEQVRCSTCGTCFRPEVLSAPTSAFWLSVRPNMDEPVSRRLFTRTCFVTPACVRSCGRRRACRWPNDKQAGLACSQPI